MDLREYLNAVDLYDDAVAERMGVNRTDLRCVDTLERRGTMTAGALAEASGLTTGAVTFLLDRLERAGVIRRVRDTEDRRRVLVELVPDAALHAYHLHKPMIADMRELARHFRMDELSTIRDFLCQARSVYELHAPLLRGAAPGPDRAPAGVQADPPGGPDAPATAARRRRGHDDGGPSPASHLPRTPSPTRPSVR